MNNVANNAEPKKWFINKETGESVKATKAFIRKRLLERYPPLQAKRMIADWREATAMEAFDLEIASCR